MHADQLQATMAVVNWMVAPPAGTKTSQSGVSEGCQTNRVDRLVEPGEAAQGGNRRMSDNDVELMLAFKAGDYNAFAMLVERYQRALIHYFLLHLGDHGRAEDGAQEVWRKVFRSRHLYEPKAQFRTFLFRVARNHWIDACRSSSKRSLDLPLEEEVNETSADSGERFTGRVAAIECDPGAAIERRELADSIASAIQHLPPTQKEVFVLAEFQGMRYEEIAEVLEIPVGTVKSRMFNTLRRLRDVLKKEVS